MSQQTLQYLTLIASVVVAIVVPLLQLWLGERVKNAAREGTDKALSDHEAKHREDLAAITAGHQRRLQEFSLFTQRQHAVYPKLYGRYRLAMNGFAGMAGLSMEPSFKHYGLEDIRRYLKTHNLIETDASDAMVDLTNGDRQRMAASMSRLHRRVMYRDADHAFNRAKLSEAVNELYLSEDVRNAAEGVRTSMAKVAVSLMKEDDSGYKHFGKEPYELSQDAELAVANLLTVMRAEIRRGEEASA